MKISMIDGRWPVPRFLVEAETHDERLMLRLFCTWPEYAAGEWKFRFDGYTMSMDTAGVKSFTFGWSKDEPPAVPTTTYTTTTEP